MNPSLAQRERALGRANEVRLARARIKRELRDGVLELDILLCEPPETCLNVAVFDLLQWGPGIGREAARKLTRGIVSETLRLGHLGGRSRRQLLDRLVAKRRTGVSR